MTKSELILALAAKRQSQYQFGDVELAVNTIIECLTDALSGGERIEIRGFGVFQTRFRQARIGRNPKTGESVAIPGKFVPTFKPGSTLCERVNDSFLIDVRGQHE